MTYKTLIPKQLRVLVCLAVILDLARIVLFGNTSLNYLLWNVFLAALPFIVSTILAHFQNEKRLTTLFFSIGTIIWILLLPNAPYIITDLVHIGYGHASAIFYNTILIFSCALAGLCLGLYSLSQMQHIFTVRYGHRTARMLILASILLTSFGVAIGRFFRFNSWDIFVNSGAFMRNIGDIFVSPQLYIHVYIVTGTLFLFLVMAYNAWDFNTQVK
jgi:uncharacterized membrane protein